MILQKKSFSSNTYLLIFRSQDIFFPSESSPAPSTDAGYAVFLFLNNWNSSRCLCWHASEFLRKDSAIQPHFSTFLIGNIFRTCLDKVDRNQIRKVWWKQKNNSNFTSVNLVYNITYTFSFLFQLLVHSKNSSYLSLTIFCGSKSHLFNLVWTIF